MLSEYFCLSDIFSHNSETDLARGGLKYLTQQSYLSIGIYSVFSEFIIFGSKRKTD